MRNFAAIVAGLVLSMVAGCGRDQAELRLVTPASPVDAEIVAEMVELLGDDAEVSISLTDQALSEESALDALIAGQADLAVVSNNLPYRRGIFTVMPLYPTVLHIGYFGDRDFESPTELFRGARIYAGPEGAASRMMFERYISRNNLSLQEFIYLEGPEQRPDVFVLFAPIAPDRLAMYPDIRLLSAGSPDDIGKGSGVDAAVLMNPQLRPFVIPAGTYGAATPTPILTVAVDMMLVARAEMSESMVYDLVLELHRLRPALASLRPGLFRTSYSGFDTDNSTFVLHPGLVAYLNRNEPTIYERYSGVAEVVVTVIVALFSAGFAGIRVYRVRRKNRIDTFYTDVIAIRNSIGSSCTADERAAAVQEIRDLQNTAFEMLVDEKLAADESFRIFVSLSNDALRDLAATERPA